MIDQISAVSTWKASLDLLESEDKSRTDHASTIDTLHKLFLHMSPQTAPRLQKDLESCTKRSGQILGQLFDEIDLSDKPLLSSFLRCLHAFGYFRMAQVAYHIDQTIDEEPNAVYSPTIEKVKWYDMEPLLPSAGTIGWKSIMNHCIVIEEPDLSQTCLQLLSQKLHFYSIISHTDRYKVCDTLMKRNGEKVAEKLFELIRDAACADERMIGLDHHTFSILRPFTSAEEQAAIVDAIVQDLFKTFLTQRSIEEGEVKKLHKFVNNCIMNEDTFQDVFILKLLEHLKCNMIRLKRRHSVDAEPDSGELTWRVLIDRITAGDKLETILTLVDQVKISSKSLQVNYISFWLQVVTRFLPQKTLTATNSLKIIGVCSFLVVKVIATSHDSLCEELTVTLARTIECTTQSRLDKLFGSCSPSYLIDLTKKVYENCASPASLTNAPLVDFYRSYLNRYLKCCTLRVVKLQPENLANLVSVFCDKDTCGGSSHLLQNMCIQELSRCIDDYKARISNTTMEAYLVCARMCAKRLYKFIKRNCSLKADLMSDSIDDAELSETGDQSDSLIDNGRRSLAVSSLINTISIAIEGKDQEILDCYANLLLKLFKVVESSFEEAVRSVQNGKTTPQDPLDLHLPKLLTLYIDHKELVSPYIQRDLISNLSDILMRNQKSHTYTNGITTDARSGRKAVYTQLKVKLENIKSQAPNRSIDLYQTIINKQYSVVTDQILGSFNDTTQEKLSCIHGYKQRMDIIQQISATIAEQSNHETRARLVDVIVTSIEQSDYLDHPRFMCQLALLSALIPKNAREIKTKTPVNDPFWTALPRISCALTRLCKSVELGPSIHAYKNSGAHKCNRGLQCCTYASCIKIYTAIFQNYSPRVVSNLVTDAMQICISANLIQYANYSSRLHGFLILLASAIIDLLKSICIDKKEEFIRSSMPIFLTVFSHLIRCVIMASDRNKLDALPGHQANGYTDSHDNETRSVRDDYERNLGLLARDIGKCLKHISELRVKFVDHAPHLISTYIKDVQRASCPDYIRLHLDEGIFRVFNLVDAFQKDRKGEIFEAGSQRKTTAGRASGSLFEMIHARLDQASREIFRDMHDNHNKFHRYVGKC